MMPPPPPPLDKNHLAEVVRSKTCWRMYGKTPHTPPFWAYSCDLPQQAELLAYPLVISLLCPLNASPNDFLVRVPQLKTHF